MTRAISFTAPALAQCSAAQSVRQPMPAAEDVQREIAILPVIAVEEAAFLMAVQRIVGGVEIKDDLPGRPGLRVDEQIDKGGFDRQRVVADLVIECSTFPRPARAG